MSQTIKYFYKGVEYTTLTLAQVEATAEHELLRTEFDTFCTIKTCSQNEDGSWLIEPTVLTNLDDYPVDTTQMFNISDVVSSDTETGISRADLLVKIDEYRQNYVDHMQLAEIGYLQENTQTIWLDPVSGTQVSEDTDGAVEITQKTYVSYTVPTSADFTTF